MPAPTVSRPGRSGRILDLLLLAALLLAAGQLMVLLFEFGALERAVAGAVAFAGVLGCWWAARRRRHSDAGRRAATLVMMLLAASMPFVLDSPASWPILLVAFLYFVPDWSVAAGAAVVVALSVAQCGLLLSLGVPLMETILESLSTLVIFGCALGAAWLVVDHDRQRQEIADLLTERERGFERESELMLVRERTRAARELHDGLGHRLTIISMALQFARDAREVRPTEAWQQVDHAQRHARETLEHMRRWVRALTPPAEPAGEPLAQIAATFQQAGMQIALETYGDERQIESQVRLYERRFVQEGLTNALRHAPGAAVRVQRSFVGDLLRIEVGNDDDGSGATGAVPAEGFGLRNLRQRAEALGGTFSAVRSGADFVITAELPLTAEPSPAALRSPMVLADR